jgi:hypothetical protein
MDIRKELTNAIENYQGVLPDKIFIIHPQDPLNPADPLGLLVQIYRSMSTELPLSAPERAHPLEIAYSLRNRLNNT